MIIYIFIYLSHLSPPLSSPFLSSFIPYLSLSLSFSLSLPLSLSLGYKRRQRNHQEQDEDKSSDVSVDGTITKPLFLSFRSTLILASRRCLVGEPGAGEPQGISRRRRTKRKRENKVKKGLEEWKMENGLRQ